MKKSYETPNVEVVKFQYRDQVVAASSNWEGVCAFKNTAELEGCADSILVLRPNESK